MASQHIVVDGSNIATEGRSMPSLAQLEGALDELRKEFPDAEITVVVDATFAHRIDPIELARFEEAALQGKYVAPPAGAIGRGDAFLLRIAEKVGGIVLSNDSFQEFHAEHAWLFDRGRLLGASPVPGVGWIFVPRAPVRGPKSRTVVRDAQREQAKVARAIEEATKEVVEPDKPKPRRSNSAQVPHREVIQPQAVNDPITFITFIAAHHLGDELTGVVDTFTSHGAVVHIGDVRCYAPLTNLANPAPRSAREVLHKGEERTFVITALDPYRRGVELSLPGVGVVSGKPTEETVAGEVAMTRRSRLRPSAEQAPGRRPGPSNGLGDLPLVPKSPPPRRKPVAVSETAQSLHLEPAPPKRTPTRRSATNTAPAVVPVRPDRPAKKAPAKKVPAKKAPPKRVATSKASADSLREPSLRAVKKTIARRAVALPKQPSKKIAAEKRAGSTPSAQRDAAAAPIRKAPAKKARVAKAPAKSTARRSPKA